MAAFNLQSFADELILEDLPENIVASMEQRDLWVENLPAGNAGEEFIVSDMQKWLPGGTVKVAFLGGSNQLRKDIADTASIIMQHCNLTLDFGLNTSIGEFRSWSLNDTEYAADIRVSFDRKGFWSLVGTDSINGAIGAPTGDSGGRPNQRTLNLGGFDVFKPPTWKGTTIHEFMHALAFKHEHQNFKGPCENEFRWEDDSGYEPTQDNRGVFITDSAGRQPGIYTYLSGEPNGWPKAKVDHNLRTNRDSNVTADEFDPASIMLYRFAPLFYKSNPSPCAPIGDGQSLSDGDIKGLQHLYPRPGNEFDALVGRRNLMLLAASPETQDFSPLERTSKPAGMFAREAIKVLSLR